MAEDSATRDLSDGSPSEDDGSSYVLSSEAEDASSSWSDVEASDSSDYETTRGKKRRRLGLLPPPPRPDNVQTRKLRPPQHLRQQKEATPEETSESSPSSSEPEMVREVTDEEMERDRATIRGMWELTVVFEFFQTFQSSLALTSIPTKMDDIEQAIVKSNGQGLLARLHTDLLKGLRPRAGVDETNWTAVLARKLRSECPNAKENPFNPERGNEALDYCNAPAVDRVQVLKLLCDMRCCENDVREIFDFLLKPKSKNLMLPRKKQKREATQLNLLRKMPLGQLNASTFFWLFESKEDFDFRLYREIREHVKKNGRIRGYTRVVSWELVAADLETLYAFGEDLMTTGTHSRNLRKKILDEVMPRLEKQIEREERKQKAADRLRQHESNIILDSSGGYGRTARNRTEAKYTFEEYERAMAEAIDEGRLQRTVEAMDFSDISDPESVPDVMSIREQESEGTSDQDDSFSSHGPSNPDTML